MCGAKTDIEMHHVKHLNGKKPTGFISLISKLNRKQIALCKGCHDQVHAGRYNGLSINKKTI